MKVKVKVKVERWEHRGSESIRLVVGPRHHRRHPCGVRDFCVKPGDKLGWLQNMFFGLSQQLLRQDTFCALRPDHEWKLIAYSYYAKYQVPGNNTMFWHINANIRDLADLNCSSGFIQGTLSLDQ